MTISPEAAYRRQPTEKQVTMNSNGYSFSRHNLATRLIHAAFAIAIIVQLFTSNFMHRPRNGQPGDWLFVTHEYAGLATMGLALVFWLVLVLRRRGTRLGLLFPWFSDRRLIALWDDIVDHVVALMALSLPEHEGEAPFASAVHGLGLLLMTLLAATGSLYFYGAYEGLKDVFFFQLMLFTHGAFANVAWFYLIGHAGLGIIHHYATGSGLGEMWSLGRSK